MPTVVSSPSCWTGHSNSCPHCSSNTKPPAPRGASGRVPGRPDKPRTPAVAGPEGLQVALRHGEDVPAGALRGFHDLPWGIRFRVGRLSRRNAEGAGGRVVRLQVLFREFQHLRQKLDENGGLDCGGVSRTLSYRSVGR